jgi:hypothetical protein
MIKQAIRKTFMAGIAAMVLQAPAQSVWDGVYTDDQATRGGDTFNKSCMGCHDLKGEFSGDAFMNMWKGQSAFDIYDKMRTEMPMDNPGSLSQKSYVDVLAFLFKTNSFPSGKADLEANDQTLKQIKIEPKGR